METENLFDYIISQENNFKIEKVPVTNSYEWNFKEHISRCTNVASGHFHLGKNDGLRPYDDIVTPIVDVAFRSEGFDVKDIIPYVNNSDFYNYSMIVKKYHPQWARKNELDTFIDEVVESSIIYDLVLIKNVNDARPLVVPLQEVAFCDQTDIMSGAICLKHQYTISDLQSYKGKWNDNKIDECITMAKASKKISMANDKVTKTPSKYIECYELHGMFPETWLKTDGDPQKYVDQMHIVTFYTDSENQKHGITLYSGKDKKLSDVFKTLKIDTVRSFGRAAGRSIVERLFEPQTWNNYSAIKLKGMLDSAVNLFQTDSEEFGNQKLSKIKEATILKHEPGKPITRVDGNLQNVPAVQSYQAQNTNSARTLGNASEAMLGKNPAAGTPFALQNLVIQQGEGIHEYRRGKIATFFADVLYPDWILQFMVNDLDKGQEFSEILTLEEMQQVLEPMTANYVEDKKKELILSGQQVTDRDVEIMKLQYIDAFKKGGDRKFFKDFKDTFKDLPIKVFVNVAGKQKYMAENADKISKLLMQIIANPGAFSQIPGIAKGFNELLENSGMNPIDFTAITKTVPAPNPTQPEEEVPEESPLLAKPEVAGGNNIQQ
jgi:hypothetical protein